MPTTYYQKSSPLTPVGYIVGLHEVALDTATAAAATITATVAASSLGAVAFTTAVGVPGVADMTGTYTVQVDITSAGANMTLSTVWVRRVNDAGANIQGSPHSSPGWSSNSGTGLKSCTLATTLTTGATTDRLSIQIIQANGNTMTSQAFVYRLNTVDSYVEAPWSAGAPADPPPAGFRLIRRAPSRQAVVHASTW